jgi:hypothetical protein
MGRLLQIRVSAYTYDPDQALRAWPRLYAMAFPTTESRGRGVLELVDALADQGRFGGWSEDLKQDLGEGLRKSERLKGSLEQALADWNPSRANSLSDELEEALDELERKAPKPD